MPTIDQQLRKKGVRPTPIRVGILTLLMQTRRAYSHADLERAFDYSLDRVSLYRSLLRLEDASLIQKHIDQKGNVSYFCQAIDNLDATYPHFKCSHCETVVPLPKLPTEYLALVRQYQLDNLRLLAEGTCDDCRHRSEPSITT